MPPPKFESCLIPSTRPHFNNVQPTNINDPTPINLQTHPNQRPIIKSLFFISLRIPLVPRLLPPISKFSYESISFPFLVSSLLQTSKLGDDVHGRDFLSSNSLWSSTTSACNGGSNTSTVSEKLHTIYASLL